MLKISTWNVSIAQMKTNMVKLGAQSQNKVLRYRHTFESEHFYLQEVNLLLLHAMCTHAKKQLYNIQCISLSFLIQVGELVWLPTDRLNGFGKVLIQSHWQYEWAYKIGRIIYFNRQQKMANHGYLKLKDALKFQ